MRTSFENLSDLEIAQKLRELGDDEAAEIYEARLQQPPDTQESLSPPRLWLNTEYQYGFIPPFKSGSKKLHKIISAGNMPADPDLKGQRLNIRLAYLRAYEYPKSFFSRLKNKINLTPDENIHTILFTFEARNQLPDGAEAVAFNQTYQAKSSQQASVTNIPIFIGLTVGGNGVTFSCRMVNINNSDDLKMMDLFNSKAITSGLTLLSTTQPALVPLAHLARDFGISLATRSKNVKIPGFELGLDFDDGAVGGARLAIGSYIAVQVRRAGEIIWSDWGYNAETGMIIKTNLAPGEEVGALPFNYTVFRVSRYEVEEF